MLDKIISLFADDNATISASGRDNIKEYISLLLKHDQTIKWTLHPLGFFHAASEVRIGLRIRLHIWPPTWTIPMDQRTGEIHDHIFELNSFVLTGEVQNEIFQEDVDASSTHNLMDVSYADHKSLLVDKREQVALSTESKRTYVSGQIYRMPSGKLHRTSALGSPTVTLVLADSSSSSLPARVAVPLGQTPPPPFSRRPLNTEEYGIVREILSLAIS